MKHHLAPRGLIGAFLGAAALLVPFAAQAQHTISDASGPFSVSFRGQAFTTYFGWGAGTWDSNLASDTGAVANVVNADELVNPFPSINPGNLTGSLLTQDPAGRDLVSSSNNLYTSVGSVNLSGLSLSIPTLGTEGTGFTTIVIQGKGLGGFGFPLDSFAFGEIAGVSPVYIYGSNATDQGQWWAKWEIPGNEASYQVAITGHDAGVGVLSVSDMVVDTKWSATSYAPDSAQLVPEPGTAITVLGGLGTLLLGRRRRNVPTHA